MNFLQVLFLGIAWLYEPLCPGLATRNIATAAKCKKKPQWSQVLQLSPSILKAASPYCLYCPYQYLSSWHLWNAPTGKQLVLLYQTRTCWIYWIVRSDWGSAMEPWRMSSMAKAQWSWYRDSKLQSWLQLKSCFEKCNSCCTIHSKYTSQSIQWIFREINSPPKRGAATPASRRVRHRFANAEAGVFAHVDEHLSTACTSVQ